MKRSRALPFIFIAVAALAMLFTYFVLRNAVKNSLSEKLPPSAKIYDLPQIKAFLQNDGLYEQGRYNFKTRCSDCHGMHGEGTKNGVPLAQRQWTESDFNLVLKHITEGAETKGMPAWGKRLLEQDILALSVYVTTQSLRNPLPADRYK